jgi:iron complex transport system substrate-binding protein
LLVLSCGKEDKKHEGFTIKDDYGKDIRFDSIPRRIISLAPSITEALYAIGADSSLIGVTTYCDYPPQAKEKTKVGGLVDPNFEVIASLKPDLVLMTVEGNLKTAYDALQNLGIQVFVTNPRDVEGIKKMLTAFGAITGRQEQAEKLTASLDKEREKLLEDNKLKQPDDILFLISVHPLITSNKNSFTNGILELAGLNNIYKDEPIDYPSISYEDIIKRNPRFIVIPLDTVNTVLKQTYLDELNRSLTKLDAVKNNKIIFADANILFRPGPRVVNAANYLKNIVFSYKNN